MMYVIPSRALRRAVTAIPSASLARACATIPSHLLSQPVVTIQSSRLVALDFDESKHPRDSHGRFGDGGGGEAQGTTYVTRFGPDVPAGGDPDRTAFMLGQAALIDDSFRDAKATDPGAELYPHADEFSSYADVPTNDNGEPSELPDHWEPGSVYALSESASYWQQSFANSRDVQAAADGLMGYQQSEARTAYEGEPQPKSAAVAQELLNALAGDGPDGAASAFMLNSEYFDESPTIGLQHYGPTELVRGVDDKTGEMRATFQDALDNGTSVEWSISSFVQGGDTGQTRMDEMVGDGASPEFTVEDPETGERMPQSADDNAAETALQYVAGNGVPEAPMLIRTSATALNLDGGWEAVAGGTFAVDEIRTATPEELTNWNVHADGEPITVVQLHQVENVKVPDPVKIAA